MKHFTFFLAILISGLCQAQDTTKVLFIGNSFSSQNNLPALFSQLGQGSGNNVVVASHMPGGISVGDIAQGTSAHMNNPYVYSLIKSNDWDYLVLQDNQGRFCLGYGQFPPTSLVIEGHLKIRDSLLFYHPCAHMIWFAGFGPKYGYPPYGNTGIALIDSIYQNYQFLNDTALQLIAPIGPAFKRIILQYPSINLWGADDTHPSLYGSFLTAGVIYTTIFKSSPIKSIYNPGISSTIDSLLKNTAFQTTIDSLNYTGLLTITPVINQSGNTLSVIGYENCEWFYNNSPYPSNNCVAIINQPGDYYALASDLNGCKFRTCEQPFLLTDVTEDTFAGDYNISVYPNPARDNITLIDNSSNKADLQIEIYNVMGDLLRSEIVNRGQQQINIEDLSNGLYIIVIKSKDRATNLKLIIQR